ncbi:hypothetical protein BGZ65_003629, partial [Modicella reniformis]
MALGPSILPVFEQLGLLEELKKIALPCPVAEMYTNEIEKLGTIDMSDHEKLTTYEADVLVGADGAYSGVRQSMCKRLDERGRLPKSDQENFSIGSVIMVGVAEPKDPTKYPQLNDN